MNEPPNKILTWQPRGRPGAYISVANYKTISNFILDALRTENITLKQLIELGEVRLAQEVHGNIAWNILIVKRDLEARGLVRNFVRWAPHKEYYMKLNMRVLKKYNHTAMQLEG